MIHKQIRDLIKKENPQGNVALIEMYVHQFATYLEAEENIQQNGVIVSHPRTGQPMENPYLKIRTAAQATMSKMRILKVGQLWQAAIMENAFSGTAAK